MPSNTETFTQFVQQAPLATQVQTSDLACIIQNGQTKRIPAAQIGGAASPTVPPAGATYAVLPTDTFIAIAKLTANTVQLPSGPTFGQRIMVADCAGNASTYPITVAAGAGDTIDGLAAYLMLTDWQSVELQYIQALNLWKVM